MRLVTVLSEAKEIRHARNEHDIINADKKREPPRGRLPLVDVRS